MKHWFLIAVISLVPVLADAHPLRQKLESLVPKGKLPFSLKNAPESLAREWAKKIPGLGIDAKNGVVTSVRYLVPLAKAPHLRALEKLIGKKNLRAAEKKLKAARLGAKSGRSLVIKVPEARAELEFTLESDPVLKAFTLKG